MTEATRRMVELVRQAQTAWDQCTIQRHLPTDTRWLVQGHPC
jgi:hypothetical protein